MRHRIGALQGGHPGQCRGRAQAGHLRIWGARHHPPGQRILPRWCRGPQEADRPLCPDYLQELDGQPRHRMANSRPCRPQIRGKMERFHGIIKGETRRYGDCLDDYIEQYNTGRPHRAPDIDNHQTPQMMVFFKKRAVGETRHQSPRWAGEVPFMADGQGGKRHGVRTLQQKQGTGLPYRPTISRTASPILPAARAAGSAWPATLDAARTVWATAPTA